MTNTHTSSSRPKRRPSVAVVLAFVALIAALSNGAYAVTAAQKNSVVSKSIKNGSVKAADLAPGAVRNPKLANNAVNSAKIADGSIKAADLAPGVIPGGNPGGNPGDPTPFTITTVTAESPATGDADGITNGGQHGIAIAAATCPAGTMPIGGGAAWTPAILDPDDKNNYLKSSYRTSNGWRAMGIVDFGAQGTIKLRAYAYCLNQAN